MFSRDEPGSLRLQGAGSPWQPARRMPSAGGPVRLPLIDLCRTILDASRRDPARRRILILESAEGLARPAAVAGLELHFLRPAAGERIGHADLLLALCMGVTHILWQQEGTGEAGILQRQERQLCDYLGGKGRISLISGSGGLRAALADLAFLPLEVPPVPAGPPPVRSTRRETARACARFLRGRRARQLPLPDFAPYGRVQISAGSCTGCQSCVWMCPVNALSVPPGGGGISLQESDCIQCGMCRASCPEGAIELQPRLNLGRSADSPRPVLQALHHPCSKCCAPVPPQGLLRRLLRRILGGARRAAAETAARPKTLCRDCRRAARGQAARPRAAAAAFPALDG